MRSPVRLLAPLGVAAIIPFALSACGGDSVPGNAVVQIGPDSIKQTAFNHWMEVAATGNAQQQGQTGKAVVPDPPNFTACVANKKKTAPKPAKGQPNPTDEQFKTQCQTEYNQLRDSVMSFLISSAWIQGEAHDRNLKFTDAQAKKEFDKQKQASFPKDSDYQKFLKDSGYVPEDLLYRIRIQQLSSDIQKQVLKGKDKVTDAAISQYYNKNKSRFASPETRDVRLVLTKTEAQAKEARAALEDGQSWKSVAAKYSIDETSKGNGGQLSAVAKGQQEAALDTAMFSASKGELSQPVKTQFGWYVFEVSKVNPAVQQTEAEAKETIRQLLVNEQQQNAMNAFLKDFRSKWKDRTVCRSGFKTADCKGEKEPETNTAAAGAQQQQQQQQQPTDAGQG